MRIYDALKASLLDGELHPGERIATEQWGARFGVSKQPVMEAIRVLSAEGFLDIIPQVGVRVKTPARNEVADFFRVFAAAEGVAAGLAACRRTSEQLVELRHVCEQLDSACGRPGSDRARTLVYRILNRSLHEVVHEMADSPAVQSLGGTFWDRSDFYINTFSPDGSMAVSDLAERLEEHRQIAVAIAQQDSATARLVMEGHITRNIMLADVAQVSRSTEESQ